MNSGIARSNAPYRCKLTGVSQGYVLGPHFLILAINYRPCNLSSKPIVYLDDTTCVGSGKTESYGKIKTENEIMYKMYFVLHDIRLKDCPKSLKRFS